jgi:pentatricopeptide repeat domain-containing protein 1
MKELHRQPRRGFYRRNRRSTGACCICHIERNWITRFLFATAILHCSLVDAFSTNVSINCKSKGWDFSFQALLNIHTLCDLRRKGRRLSVSKRSVEDEVIATTNVARRASQRLPRNRTSGAENVILSAVGGIADVERQISMSGRQGRTDEALQLFYTIPHPTVRQINAAIDACARARPVRLSTVLDILESYTTIAVSDITNETEAFLSPSNSKVIAPLPTRLDPNVYTYGALMNAISRLGQVELALQVLNYMKRRKVVLPNAVVYQSAITAAANAARSDVALQILESARREDVPLTVIGYNAVITAASRAMNSTLAVQILRTMQSNPSLPEPDSVTYGTVMAACENCNEWKHVLEFAEEVDQTKNPELQLDGMAITSVLKACQQLGYASMAIEYLNRMKLGWNTREQQPPVPPATSGRQRIGSKQPLLGPDAVAYRLAISACARGGAWHDGIRLLNEYCEIVNDHDVIAYTAAITGCEYAGQWVEAVQLLIRMRSAGVQPNVVTFAAVIGACATACANMVESNSSDKSGKKEKLSNKDDGFIPLPQKKALQILNVMKKDSTVVNPNIQVYNAAIRACAEALDMKRAFQLFHMLRDEGHQPNIITYGTLMLACERVGSIDGMNQVFSLMRTAGSDDEGPILKPNDIIYGTAISCCRKAGDCERTYLLLEKMIRDGFAPNVATINTVLIAQMEASHGPSSKELAVAMNVFKRFFLGTNPETQKLSTPNRQSYSIMIRALASNQRPKEAEAFLVRMRTVDNMVPDVDLYTMLVSAYERIGQPLNALRLMESMREDGYDFYDVEVLNTLFKRLVKLASALGQTFGKGQANLNVSTTLL